ncbi:MAG: glycoside hydrolase family 2 [Bacteroidales bacterium]|nr:glycoside hydrolase family 2 [Bacteroidales bacterium]
MKKLFLFFLIIFATLSLSAQNEIVSLNGQWNLTYGLCDKNAPATPDELKASGWESITATVPGNVELDLVAAGKIDYDIEQGSNVYKLREYEVYQWWYSRTFETPKLGEHERALLVFDGIDCIAKIFVNNKLVAETDNMLISHTIDVTDVLNPSGSNTLDVRIDPVVLEARKYVNGSIGSRKFVRVEYEHIRKAGHMYGWDILPRIVSAGLWRDVTLVVKKANQLDNIFWMTDKIDMEKKTADLLLDWQITTDYLTVDSLYLEYEIMKEGKTVFSRKEAIYSFCGRQRMTLENVDYWWPRGYGEPALYDTKVRLLDKDNKVLDEREAVLGVRTVQLKRSELTTKENPGYFYFLVNGEKIFVRGTNWVPLDALHSRDHQFLQSTIDMVIDLNCNLIRCWGGNVYETDEFYKLCNENGIMIWQDFGLAGTAYTQDLDFAQKMREEAIQVIVRLRNNPCLVLWSGNNEIDISIGWNFTKPVDPNMDLISRDILTRAVWEYDPLREFLPSCPYISPESFAHELGARNVMPQVHLWGPRGYYKTPFYTQSQAHFVAEIGYHGCPSRSSLEKMMSPKCVYPWTKDGKWNDEWMTKAVRCLPAFKGVDDRNDLMINQVKVLFGEKLNDLDKFIFASQVVQGEAMKYFVELWRMRKFNTSGIIWWNVRDGWPIISDAVVDYYNNKKLAYYYIRQVQTNTCVMIGDAVDGLHPIVAVNDTREAERGDITVKDADSGEILYQGSFNVPANGKVTAGYIAAQSKQAMWLIDYTVDGKTYHNHYMVGEAPFKLKDYERWHKKLQIQYD